jgi:hypothetical protein|tara:strand:+ start:612 stop:845 length:234 start_codon:yes stop_codon:yes gene_type:complete
MPRGFANAASVTPADTGVMDNSGVLYIGTAGDGTLKVTTTDDDTISFAGVTAGWFGELRVQLVWSTGTGASDIVVAY